MFRLHEDILVAVRTHRHAEHQLANLLARLEKGRGYTLLGYASLGEYAQVALQLEPRKARALAQLGRQLPVLDEAMKEGVLPWTKARELMRVVVPETQQQWLERAQGVSSRELERHVAVCARRAAITSSTTGSGVVFQSVFGARDASMRCENPPSWYRFNHL